MSVVHRYTIRTPYPTSLTQFGCNDTYVALPFNKSSIGVWSLESLQSKPLELVAHKKKVSAIAFGKQHNPTLLCTAGSDYIIVWNVEQARATYETGQQIRGVIVGTSYQEPQYLSFSADDSLLAVCVENDVLVLDAKEERLDTRLEGHSGQVMCAEFCVHSPDMVISASEDRTFKVWDIANQCLIYQSSIVSASPFLCLALDPIHQCVALGTTDGQLRIYDLEEGKGFRCLHHIDIAKHVRKQTVLKTEQSATSQGPATISSRPSWQTQSNNNSSSSPPDEVEDEDVQSESGESILGVAFSQPAVIPSMLPDGARGKREEHRSVPSFLLPDTSLVDELQESSSHLLVGTPGALLQLNASSCTVEQYIDFQDDIQSEEHLDQESKQIGVAGNYAFSPSPPPSQMICLVGGLFHNSVNVLNVSCKDSRKVHSSGDTDGNLAKHMDASLAISAASAVTDGENQAVISIVPDTPLTEHSLLRAEMVPKSSQQPASLSANKSRKPRSAGAKGHERSKGIKDQPLTFKSKVHSSGYSAAPRTKMFSPQTKQPAAGKLGSNKSKTAGSGPGMSSMLREYPRDAEPPETLRTKLVVSEQGAPINSIQFSDDGQSLVCGMADRSAQLFKMPLTGKGAAFSGHNGAVKSARWSHSGQWVITASVDRTAKVWTRGMSEPVMTLDRVTHNFTADKEKPATTDKSNAQYGKEIHHAQFYYVDRFILLTSGDSLFLYKYHLDTKVDDIKRYQSHSRYKLVKKFQLQKAQQITSVSAINAFNSYIVLCAGSDKSLEVIDLSVGNTVAHIPEVHSRAVHAIAQNQGSIYASHAASNYDLFATAAVTSGIKVWDVRTQKCVKHFEGHMNRSHHCGLCFSPCGKYITTGAEDRSAYVYDIRGGTYIRKLSGHTEVVSDVAFHPLYPEIVTATLDGKLRLYSDR
ncbi:WD repeat-containing protein 27-like [Diadema antillarum]|uniref:WD repeat-containing protein 27-like n=1 Tax=Diadema antillarum TaxID=105358 RepID=UPI003A84BFFB